jgi:hypothetical protein
VDLHRTVRHVPNSDDGLQEYRKIASRGAGTGLRQLLRRHHAERQLAKTSSFRMGRQRSSTTRLDYLDWPSFNRRRHAESGWVLGGAMEQVPIEATTFGHRDRRLMANPVACTRNRSSVPRTRRGRRVAHCAVAHGIPTRPCHGPDPSWRRLERPEVGKRGPLQASNGVDQRSEMGLVHLRFQSLWWTR